jgi:hypothetical protein
MKTKPLPRPMPQRLFAEFDDWVYCQSGDEGIKALIEVFDTCLVGPQIAATECRIDLEQRARVREKVIALIVARGSTEFRDGGVTWKTDGHWLRAVMAF